MPIALKSSINSQVHFALWQIDETEAELLDNLQLDETELADLNQLKVDSRRLEWLGARNALKALLNNYGQFYVRKDTFGKPHIIDYPIGISVSHTKGFGAAAINLKGPVGVDIEYERAQVLKIAHKFLHESEKEWAGTDVQRLTRIWSAKEALYKLHGRTQLTFAEQLVVASNQGTIIEDGESKTFSLHMENSHGIELCCAY